MREEDNGRCGGFSGSLSYEGSRQEDLDGLLAFAGPGHRIRGGGVQAGLDEERKREVGNTACHS